MSEQRFSSKEQFAEEVRVEFEKRIGKSAIVQKINKNNGIVWYGLTVLEDKINISPTIYLEPYYEVCEDVGMEFIIDKIEKVYEDNKPNESMDLGKILDYESIKENLRAKLINYELNKDFLKEVPHRRFLDLAIVAFLELESNEMIEGQATITVKDNLQQAWGVEAGDIIDAALDNIKGDITLDSITLDTSSLNKAVVSKNNSITYNQPAVNTITTSNKYYKDNTSTRSGTSQNTQSISNFNYITVLFRGQDHLTLADWKNGGAISYLTNLAYPAGFIFLHIFRKNNNGKLPFCQFFLDICSIKFGLTI